MNENNLEKKTQNFAIAYNNKQNQLTFGLIKNIYNIKNSIYIISQKLVKSKYFSSNHVIEYYLNKYFMICSLSDNLEIIKLENILNKCVLIVNANEYFISICNELNEHD